MSAHLFNFAYRLSESHSSADIVDIPLSANYVNIDISAMTNIDVSTKNQYRHALKDVLHSYLWIAFRFNDGQLPAFTIHLIHTRICMVYSKCVSSDMYMEHCFLAPWAMQYIP